MYSFDWSYAYGRPQSQAQFKVHAEDFQVHELLPEPFSGEGEHVVIQVEKRGLNTEEVARSIARLINKPYKLISYAGLKDKQAITTQWFSIHVPGEEIKDVGTLAAPGWRVVAHSRHSKKLKTGCLSGNQFIIQLRALTEIDDVLERIGKIELMGVPNYFGEQRFGRNGANLIRAEELLLQGKKVKDRYLKGLYYSAARSWLYNLVLSHRVQDLTWNLPLAGDVMQLAGSHSIFTTDGMDTELVQRIKDKDVSPASPLPGKTKNKAYGDAKAVVDEVFSSYSAWVQALEQQGLEEAWRANILYPEQLHAKPNTDGLQLRFTLPAGTYATAILREMVQLG